MRGKRRKRLLIFVIFCLTIYTYRRSNSKNLTVSDEEERVIIPRSISRVYSSESDIARNLIRKVLNRAANKSRSYPSKDNQLLGKLNAHIWYEICSPVVNSLRQYPLFPSLPSQRLYLSDFSSGMRGSFYGQRIMGYIRAPRTGKYKFMLNGHLFAELWLSSDDNIENVRMIAKITRSVHVRDKVPRIGRISGNIALSEGQFYYIECLHVTNGGNVYRDLVQVLWMIPDISKFSVISGEYVYSYMKDDVIQETNDGITEDIYYEKYNKILSKSPAVKFNHQSDNEFGEDDEDFANTKGKALLHQVVFSEEMKALKNSLDKTSHVKRRNLHHLNLINKDEIRGVITKCRGLTKVRNRVVKRYQGVWMTRYSERYPRDGSDRIACLGFLQAVDCKGNAVIPENEVFDILGRYWKEFDGKTKRRYKLSSLPNMEKTVNEDTKQYLIEIELKEKTTKRSLRLSEYITQYKNSTYLCKHPTLDWRDQATVNIILTVKNQGRWAQHFINQFSKLYTKTLDGNFNVIIVDYSSNDINIQNALKRSVIKNYKILTKKGAFHKTEAIQTAVDTVQDPHSIILLFDLHISVPENILDDVRKHCLEGLMAYNPVLFRLSYCGRPSTPARPARGYWETFGYGIFGIYKSDWDKFGGMNVKEFRDKWGGEDWEMIDRVLASGLDIQRLRVPGLYHFYHSKAGMWHNE